MTEPVTEAIRRALNSGLLAHDQAVLVGISGGPDSTALLLALAEAGIPVIAAHLNHRVRGAEADRDEDWVRALTAERGLPLVVERLDLTLSAGGNLEARARRERYAFLGRAARMVGARAIAVGHTADDQIETLLIRLVRGTGPAGLGGMAPSTRLDRLTGGAAPVVRPLLEVRRMSTIAYCRARGIEPLTDSTNASEQFLRNRLRTGVLPALLRENPRLVEDVTAAMTLLRDQQAFVRAEVDRRWDEIAGPAGSLRRDVLVAWPMALASEAIRLAAERIVGPPSPLEHRHVSQLLAAAGACGPRRLHLPGGLEAVVDDGHLRIQRRRPASTPPAPVVLAVPGTVRFGPWTLRAERRTARDVRRSSGPRHVWVRSGGPFLVRSRRPGDRYRPFGGPGSVMLQDALVNWKTPREERDFVPVVVEGEAIVWLVGGRVAGDQAVAEGDEATWIEAHRDA